MAAYVSDDNGVSHRRLRDELTVQTHRAFVHPVFFGSAITGAGIDALTSADRRPPPDCRSLHRWSRRGPGLQDRTRSRGREDRVRTDVLGHDPNPGAGRAPSRQEAAHHRHPRLPTRWCDRQPEPRSPATSPRSGASPTVGSATRSGKRPRSRSKHQFAPPTLETVITPRNPSDRARLRVALDQLAEQDPLIDVRQNDAVQEMTVWLYGEVQKEVIGTTLATDFGVDVSFLGTTTIYVERPIGNGLGSPAPAMGRESVFRDARVAHRARAGRVRRRIPRRRRPA